MAISSFFVLLILTGSPVLASERNHGVRRNAAIVDRPVRVKCGASMPPKANSHSRLAREGILRPSVFELAAGLRFYRYDAQQFLRVSRSTVATNTPGASLAAEDLSGSTLSNYNRFVKNLPGAAESPTITKLPGGAVEFSAKVPANNIPGSYATYTKVVGPDGVTTSFIKTTVAPDGSIVSVKQKFP